MEKERLKIAIAGGGIASLCLAHSLTSQHPQWDVKVFEASPSLRDEGAAVGLGRNAQEALELISPSLRAALDEAGGVRMQPAARMMVATGPDAGKHAGDITTQPAQIAVHRTAFWQALMHCVPEGVLEMGKKLASIETSDNDSDHAVTLHFEDKTTYTADALVGCDGINSIVRRKVLGEDHPAAKPVYTNTYNHRVVVPLEAAKEAFGEDYCKLQTQTGWIGKGGFLLTDYVDHGQSMQVIAGWNDRGPWPHENSWVEWDKDRMRSDLADWGEIGKGMIKIFESQNPLYAAGLKSHLDTPTYINSHICIAGDAALAFPPAQGAGAGQAIEDALILSTVLGATTSKDQIVKAFEVYDEIRRPRRTDVSNSSKRAGRLITGQDPDVGLDREKLNERLKVWASNIFEYDLKGSVGEAREKMGKS